MKQEPKVISIQRTSAFRLDAILTGEEAIVLRALAGGLTDRQVCHELGMNPNAFLSMMRDMREKLHMTDNVSLIDWAMERIKGVDRRIDHWTSTPCVDRSYRRRTL
jgi:DNA-binding CsgD family transcriptional regulator